METVTGFIFLGSKITADDDCRHKILKKCLLLGRKAMTNLGRVIESRDITLLTKVYVIKAMVFPVVMYGCESLTLKKAEYQRTDAFELWCWRRLLRVPLDCKEIQPVNPKGDQPWIFIGRTDVEAEAPIPWPPDGKSQLTGVKTLMLGKIEGQEENGVTEDEMVEWYHRLNEHEFEQTAGDNEGQGSLLCFSPWGCKALEMPEWLNNNRLNS